MENTRIISILILTALLSSCGFKPIKQKESSSIYLQNINIVGEQRLAYLLKNNIRLLSDSNAKNKYDSEIIITNQKNIKSKDKTGKITRYSLIISANIKLISLDDKTETQNTFSRNADYEVATIHSDTVNNENNASKNIIEQLSDDIINFINLSVKNR